MTHLSGSMRVHIKKVHILILITFKIEDTVYKSIEEVCLNN